MIADFLKHHNIPYPAHLCGWEEYDYVRILRFKGAVNNTTIPKILEFKTKMEKAGLPLKNIIFDGKNVTEIDSAAVAAILVELQKENQKMGMVNTPKALKSYLEIFHEEGKLQLFDSEKEAVEALNIERIPPGYLPVMGRTLRKNKALTLFIALVLFIIALPFFESNMMGIFYLSFFTFVLLAGIYAVSYNIRHVAGGILLAAPTIITAWSNIFIQDQKIVNAELVFLTIFLIYTIAVILGHVLSVKKVTLNELYGALCVYIMVGMTFGVIYALLISLDPSSLAFPPDEPAPKMTAFFYFSFVTMSSTGFSGFTAVSPLARSIVVVQVIMGLMYISVLLGKLVSAASEDDSLAIELEAKLKTDVWSQELAENFFRQRAALLLISMSMINYSSSVLMTVLHLPFFMDSWGTSLAVVLGGLRAGLAAGIIYNMVMAYTFWEPSYWVWMFCNILVAVLTWAFLKIDWINLHKPLKLLTAGVVTGVLNSFVVMLITYLTNLPTYQGTMAVYRFFESWTGSSTFASIAEKMAVEVADKTISLVLVAVAVLFIRDFLNWNQKKSSTPKVTS